MPFTKKKIILSLLGSSIATGIAVVGTNYMQPKEKALNKAKNEPIISKVKLGTKYTNSLITENLNLWINRFDDLKKGDPKHSDLIAAKSLNNDAGPWELKDACQKIIDGEDGENFFSDFQQFCVMKNKDESQLITSSGDFASKFKDFNKADENKLSKGFATIWKDRGKDDWKDKMLKECKRLENKMYVGDNEDDDFEKYCTKGFN